MTNLNTEMTASEIEAIAEHARQAYELCHWSTVKVGPLTAYENYVQWLQVICNKTLEYKGVELDIWVATWKECIAFEMENK